MRSRIVLLLTLPLATTRLPAQASDAGQGGRRTLLERAAEIALARSAAPPYVSAKATVHVLTDRGFEIAEEGTNGVHCLVDRSWRESVEPICYDAEGSATIMLVTLRRGELWQRNATKSEMDADIAKQLATGAIRPPRRVALAYMMSSRQLLIGDDGRAVGAWQPHLMFYYPYLAARDLGADVPDGGVAVISDPGRPTSSIVVVLPHFADRDSSAATRHLHDRSQW